MSYDLFFKKTNHNYARGAIRQHTGLMGESAKHGEKEIAAVSQDLISEFANKDWANKPPTIEHECGPEVCSVSVKKEPPTVEEKAKLDKLTKLKTKVDSGDKYAQRQWKDIISKLAALKTKAKKGDLRAKHALEILEGSGLFGPAQKLSGSVMPRDQDIIEKMIQQAGYNSGWPVYISTSRHADYKNRAAKGDKLASEVLDILDRHAKAGQLKISDEKKSDSSRYPIGNEPSVRRRKKFEEDKIMSTRSIGRDELDAARDGGSCEREAMSRTQGIVISDREIKDAMRGSYAQVMERNRRSGRRRHHRNVAQQPGQYSSQSSNTYVASRDAQKSQIVRNLYRQIKQEHINWMIAQDRQNGINNQTADRYQQAAKAWARDQLQRQQLPTRFSAGGASQWYQPVTWFQAQAQAVLNNTVSQRSTQINSPFGFGTMTSSLTYANSPYPLTAPPSIPVSSSPADVYYPSSSPPSDYDDNQDYQEGDISLVEGRRRHHRHHRRNMAQGQRSGQFPGQYSSRSPGQYTSQVPGWTPNRYSNQVPGQYPRQYPGQASRQYPGQVPGQYLGQIPGQIPGQYPSSSNNSPSYDDDQEGSSFVGDEARAEGENSSSCGEGLPHDEYRALVMNQAIKNAGGKTPGTKHLFAAKKAVDNALGNSGVSIYIPGAGPARRTV